MADNRPMPGRTEFSQDEEKSMRDNTATSIARGMNAVSRATGLPYNKGAVGVQQNADMLAAEKISDAVPRRGEDRTFGGPGGAQEGTPDPGSDRVFRK